MLNRPHLIITIDTEEGFDWTKPFSRKKYTTETLFHHDFYMSGFYNSYGMRPISLLTYPILNDPDCQRLLHKYHNEGRYYLGTHLHSWVTPPFKETLSNKNSYACHLDYTLRWQKIDTLTQKFKEIMGFSPIFYKCGRYGICEETYDILEEMGYKYDFTPYTKRDFTHKEGPNFHHIHNHPYYCPKSKRLNVYPMTSGYTGKFRDVAFLQKSMHHKTLGKLKIRAILSKIGLINFIPLSPEGIHEEEMKMLTREMIKNGEKYFHLSYHASSFTVGGSPYCKKVQNARDLSEKLKNYIHFFEEIGGNIHTDENDLIMMLHKDQPHLVLS